jgi:hypothetical protein
MKMLNKKILKEFELLPVGKNEEKIIISIVSKINNETLKTETSLVVKGNKIQATKVLKELLLSNKAIEFQSILEMIKDNI